MEFTKFNSIYSYERIKKYYIAAKRDEDITQILYFYNHRLAKSFQPLVSNVEVMLRNKLNKAIAIRYSDNKWLLHRISGFIPTGHTAYSGTRLIHNEYLRKCLDKADRKLVRKGRRITQDRLIAELDFGFWTALYNDGLPTEISAAVMSIFGPLPAGTNRQVIKGELNKIREFRNRICHNNTLFFTHSSIDTTSVLSLYSSIENISKYLDEEASKEFQKEGLDNVKALIKCLNFDIKHHHICKIRNWFRILFYR